MTPTHTVVVLPSIALRDLPGHTLSVAVGPSTLRFTVESVDLAYQAVHLRNQHTKHCCTVDYPRLLKWLGSNTVRIQ
jgi:hypothetical protein